MRNFVSLIFVLIGSCVFAQEWEDRQVFNQAQATTTLRIISSTDTDLFAPIIAAFVATNSDVAIEYLVTGTADIDKRFRQDPGALTSRSPARWICSLS